MAKGIGPVKLTRADQKILKSYIPHSARAGSLSWQQL